MKHPHRSHYLAWLGPAVALGCTTAASLPAAPDASPSNAGPSDAGPLDTSLPDAFEPADLAQLDVDALLEVTAPHADAPDASPRVEPKPSPGPGFHRRGQALVDAQGRTVVIHGVNVANSAKYTTGNLAWQSAENFKELAGLGLDSVRLLTFWSALMPTQGVIDTSYLEQYAARVAWAHEAGLLVVVDMHQDVFGVGFGDNGAPRWACDEAKYASFVHQEPWYTNYLSPEVKACFDHFYGDDSTFARFQETWVAVAAHFADDPAVLGFDLLNEPHWGSSEPDVFLHDVWQPRMEQLAAAIHAVAPNKLVFFESTTVAQLGVTEPFVPTADPRVAYAPHFYHPLVHDGADYTDDMEPFIDVGFDGIARTGAALGGVPIWMGEFGGPTRVNGFDRYLEAMLTRFVARGWSWSYYSDDPGNGFGIREVDFTFKSHVTERLGHPYARRVPGDVTTASLTFASGGPAATLDLHFTWDYDAPLEVWVGADGRAEVALDADPTVTVPCAQRPGSVPGIWECPGNASALPPRFGETYRLTAGP